MAEAQLKQRADNDVEKRQAIKEGSKQAASKQAVGVNEPSFREDEERLQSVAFAALNLNHLVNWKSS
jgi:hypothetical protein